MQNRAFWGAVCQKIGSCKYANYTVLEIKFAEAERPVSLTSIPCEVMESVVRDTLLEFVMDKNLLTNCYQHVFRKRRSCLTNLLETFEAWISALDEGFGIDVIYLDHRKAFDTVPHNRLMLKVMKL